MSGLPSVTIITVAFESAAVLPQFVTAAAKAAPAAEILIVDNASTDGGPELVASHPRVTVTRSAQNVGFGRACNLGVARASGDLLVFANPDLRLTRCDPAALPSGESFGLVAGALVDTSDKPMPALYSDRGPIRSWYWEVLGRLHPTFLPRSRRQVARRPGYASGALFAADAEEFRRIGGFDPRYFLYHEDRDVAKRYREEGLPLRFATGLSGCHLYGSSSSASSSISRQGWSMVSWLEYTGVWDRGEESIRLFGRLIHQLRIIGDAAAYLSRFGVNSDAWRRKGEEYRALRSWILEFDRHLPVGVDGLYPYALSALDHYRTENGI